MNKSLLDLLRHGGYILYVRHGEATEGVDQHNLNFWNCFTQRNLSREGMRQAMYYGKILRDLGIPINYPIIASPFCRTIQTAQLAFGRTNVQINPFLFEIYKLGVDSSSTEQEKILDYLQSKLETKPPQGRNKVIVAHGFPKDIGLGEIPNMGTVIVKPLGKGNGYEIVGRLSLEDLENFIY